MPILRRAPGPRGEFLLGNMRMLQRDPLSFLGATAHTYGAVARYPIGPWRNLFLITDPEALKYVLVTNQRNYSIAVRSRNALKRVLGEGLFTSEGPTWLHRRRLMQPQFGHRQVAMLVSQVTSTTQAAVERWRCAPPGEPLNISAEMTRLALDIAARAFFSIDLQQEKAAIGTAVTALLEAYTRWILSPAILLPDFLAPQVWRVNAAIRYLDQAVRGIIRERRRTGQSEPDLLGLLLDARDPETGEGLGETEIRDEVLTLLIAGHETTAQALTWAFHLLARSPQVAQALQAELVEVLGGRLPGAADAAALPYTRMVLQETLRLYPPAWVMFRLALQADEIGGYHIPAGSRITISPYVTHRLPELWEDPSQFKPERFTAAAIADRHPFAYLPFGAGPRQCIGKHFALLEAQLVLATVAQQVSFQETPDRHVEPRALVTLRPRDDLTLLARLA
jgi:cytochrome P450